MEQQPHEKRFFTSFSDRLGLPPEPTSDNSEEDTTQDEREEPAAD